MIVRPRSEYLAFGKPNFSSREVAAVVRVLESGWIGMGREVAAFEDELARALGVSHVVTVNSCTSALFLALKVLGIGEGDEVIVPSLTWCATANAALYVGATPVFCDVDRGTLSVSPGTVLSRLTSKTKAVIAVHFGGSPVDVEALRSKLPDRVAIVEDAAHAFGGRYPNGAPVGASGNMVCFSFYANKNLSTGEGGAIAVSDPARAARLSSLRQNAMSTNAWTRFTNAQTLAGGPLTELGYKMNYTDLQACIGRIQLERQAELDATRLAIARRYHSVLEPLAACVTFQADVLGPRHARHLFVVKLPVERMRVTRDEFLIALRRQNIGASIHYAPLHYMPLYAGSTRGGLPNTEWLHQRILSLPMSASMTLADADDVLERVVALLPDNAGYDRMTGTPVEA